MTFADTINDMADNAKDAPRPKYPPSGLVGTVRGKIGFGPKLMFASNGTPFATARVFYRNRPSNRDEEPRYTWIGVMAFGQTAEGLAMLSKGATIVAKGLIEQREWVNKDGKQMVDIQMTADYIGIDVASSLQTPAVEADELVEDEEPF